MKYVLSISISQIESEPGTRRQASNGIQEHYACTYINVKKGTSPRDYFHKNFHLKNFLSVLEAEETIDIFLGQALKVKIGFLTTSVHSSFCRT